MPKFSIAEASKIITSNANPRVKQIKQMLKLSPKEYFLLEGLHLFEEWLCRSDWPAAGPVLVSESFLKNKASATLLRKAASSNHELLVLADLVYRRISQLENPEGIAVILPVRSCPWDEFMALRPPLSLWCDRIQDPGNLGTMLRTAEALGVGAVIISPGTVSPFNAKVVRSSMGSILRIPIFVANGVEKTCRILLEKHFDLLVADVRRGIPPTALPISTPAILIIGSEAQGVDQKLVDNVTKFVNISTGPTVESLNAAVAAGILLYSLKSRMSDG